ncbi:MAG TPA: hypothetical protein VE090_00615 [Methylomirabilota bacterium]|nr:hypothetical protein [Methylomirabilota bacterium]
MKLPFARTISFIFNPLIVIIFAPFFLIYKTTHNITSASHWTVYTLIFLLLLAVFVIVAVKKKIFTDLDVSKREQRPLIFLISILFTLLYIAGLVFLHGPFILFTLAFGIILGIAVVSIINKRIKASVHVATITALIWAVAIGYGGYYLFLLLLIPLVAWSRLATKRHTLSEIFVGAGVGSFLSLSIYVAVKLIFHK